MANPLFGPEARAVLEKDDRAAMATFTESLHPATVAEALSHDVSVEDAWRFLQAAPIATQAAVFAYFPLDWQIEMVRGTGQAHMARLIEKMPPDDRAELLRNLDPQVREGLLRLVDEVDRRDIARLVEFPEHSVGALMTTDYAWLPVNLTVEQALERLRLQAPDKETIYYVFVVDDQRRILGVLSLRDLIMAPRTAPLAEVMNKDVLRIKATDDQELAAKELGHYDLLAIPVVDAEDRLIGIVTHDDVMDVVVEEATEDAYRMGAVGPLEDSYLETGFLKLWRNRAFWLACLFVAELFTFTALASFEDLIAQAVVLSLFLPLCISTGGNSGSQAATLITRAMALGEITPKDWFRVIRHELLMGVVLGLTLGCIGFVRASFTPERLRASSPPRDERFHVVTEPGQPVVFEKKGDSVQALIPAGAEQHLVNPAAGEPVRIILPEDAETPTGVKNDEGKLQYEFPEKCYIPRKPVPRFGLATVIGLAVAGICLWGTFIGSILPIVFRRLGADPALASSPFVATFVDVTGIVIYFSIAYALVL